MKDPCFDSHLGFACSRSIVARGNDAYVTKMLLKECNSRVNYIIRHILNLIELLKIEGKSSEMNHIEVTLNALIEAEKLNPQAIAIERY
ncbi:hypothetical protein L484_026873 [Morus notabilis]|uniref:Uncharacterized protein n=1 Tax=Morus notabilis TaxID=981085 RepID=W9RE65_9ROSA|nr:hypothetical protein L484_026873 [Morus notabilis]